MHLRLKNQGEIHPIRTPQWSQVYWGFHVRLAEDRTRQGGALKFAAFLARLCTLHVSC